MSRKFTTKLCTILILVLFLTILSLQVGASPVLKYKMRGEQVKTLQQALKDAGYNPGPVNGTFGYLTKRAVTSFQKDKDLEATGDVDKQTWNLLMGKNNHAPPKQNTPDRSSDNNSEQNNQNSKQDNRSEQGEQNRSRQDEVDDTSKVILTYKDRGEKVEELQVRLEKLNYNPGPINGYYAYMTKRAVKEFQKDNNLGVTGDVNKSTWSLLTTKSGQVHMPTGNNDRDKATPDSNPGDNANNDSQENNGGYNQNRNDAPSRRRYYRFSEGDLIKSKNSSKVYVIKNGKKRHIVSMKVFNALGYDFSQVKEVPSSVLHRLSTGNPVTMEEISQSASGGGQDSSSQPGNNKGQPNSGTGNDQQRDSIDRNRGSGQNSSQQAQLTADEKRMLNLVNQERTSRGLEPLEIDMRLVRLARKKSKDMIENNYFSHVSPTYGSVFAMLKSAGIRYRMAGENLATNPAVSGAHRALMNSSGHRRNILKPGYTKIGIGIVNGARHGKMFTQIFLDEF